MSLDYPNREIWLAKRDTPTGRFARMRRNVRMLWTNGTFNVGRTKHKVRIWNAKRRERANKRLLKKAIGR